MTRIFVEPDMVDVETSAGPADDTFELHVVFADTVTLGKASVGEVARLQEAVVEDTEAVTL